MSQAFVDALKFLREGNAANELGDELQDLVKAVIEANRSGTLTYTLKVKPSEKGSGAIIVTDTISVKVPKPDPDATFFFPNEDGFLLRKDPRQPELTGLRNVTPKVSPIRSEENEVKAGTNHE